MGGAGGLPAPGALPRPPAQQEPDADVLQIANVDVDAEQSTLMADLSRPQQQPQTGPRCRSLCAAKHASAQQRLLLCASLRSMHMVSAHVATSVTLTSLEL